MAKGAGEGWLFEGGDYSREAINRGTAIIRGNTVSDVCIIDGAKFPGSCIRHLYISHNAPYLSPPLPHKKKKKKKKIGITFVFHFSWALQPSLAIFQRERSDDRKCVCCSLQNLGGGVAVGGQIGSIMGDVQVVDAKKAWDRVAGLWKSSPLKTLVAWISSDRFESFFCCYWGSNNNSK